MPSAGKIVATLTVAFFIAIASLAYAGKPKDKPPPSEDVEDAITQLQEMTRALSGYKVLKYDSSGSSFFDGDVTTILKIFIIFCPEGSFGDGTPYDFCVPHVPEAYVIDSGEISDGVFGFVIRFDSTNFADFDAIVEQLTNGNGNDGMSILSRSCIVGNNCSPGGSGSLGLEFSFLNQYNPVAPSVGEIDWAGLEIGSITLKVNYSNIYDPNDDRTEAKDKYEVFFEMPLD